MNAVVSGGIVSPAPEPDGEEEELDHCDGRPVAESEAPEQPAAEDEQASYER